MGYLWITNAEWKCTDALVHMYTELQPTFGDLQNQLQPLVSQTCQSQWSSVHHMVLLTNALVHQDKLWPVYTSSTLHYVVINKLTVSLRITKFMAGVDTSSDGVILLWVYLLSLHEALVRCSHARTHACTHAHTSNDEFECTKLVQKQGQNQTINLQEKTPL